MDSCFMNHCENWGTNGCTLAFLGKRLYTVPPVHYRDETDICGLVARGGLMTTDNPTRFRRHPVGAIDREQVTHCMVTR
jgi:hypothetical protein